MSIEGIALCPQARDGPHDAVGFKNADAAICVEGRRHGAKGVGRKEGVGLVKRLPLEADAAHVAITDVVASSLALRPVRLVQCLSKGDKIDETLKKAMA